MTENIRVWSSNVRIFKKTFFVGLLAAIACSVAMYYLLPIIEKGTGEVLPSYALTLGIVGCMSAPFICGVMWAYSFIRLKKVSLIENNAEDACSSKQEGSDINHQETLYKVFIFFDASMVVTSLFGSLLSLTRLPENHTTNYIKIAISTGLGIFFLWRFFEDRKSLILCGLCKCIDEFERTQKSTSVNYPSDLTV